ncbi:hypothetical protein AB0M00_07125 [Streptomyces chartreusis]|uniref:hypothetical protein n=1 Tax=Streptomyces chartreusis TaxID=1969 RepID=UPI00341972E5
MPITVGERAPARIGRSAEGAAPDTGRTAEAHRRRTCGTTARRAPMHEPICGPSEAPLA